MGVSLLLFLFESMLRLFYLFSGFFFYINTILSGQLDLLSFFQVKPVTDKIYKKI